MITQKLPFIYHFQDSGKCRLAVSSFTKTSKFTAKPSTTSCQSSERSPYWLSSGSSTRKVTSQAGGPWFPLSRQPASWWLVLKLSSTNTSCPQSPLCSSAKSVTLCTFGTGLWWSSRGSCSQREVPRFWATCTLSFSCRFCWVYSRITSSKTKSGSARKRKSFWFCLS